MASQDYEMPCGCIFRNGEVVERCSKHGGDEDDEC
jgi:hypothetical protein